MKYFGRERVCLSFIEKESHGKILNIGAGEIKWLENDIFLGKKNFISTDIEDKNLGIENPAKTKLKVDARKIPLNLRKKSVCFS